MQECHCFTCTNDSRFRDKFICTNDNHFRDKIEQYEYENEFEIKDQMYLVVSSFFPSALKVKKLLFSDEYGLEHKIDKADTHCMLMPFFNWYGIDWKYSLHSLETFLEFGIIPSYNDQIEIQKKVFSTTSLFRHGDFE